MRIISVFFKTLKGIYDLIGTYLLIAIIPFIFASLVFHIITLAASMHLGFSEVDEMWSKLGESIPFDVLWIRFFGYLPLHWVVYRVIKTPRERVNELLEKFATRFINGFKKITQHFPLGRFMAESSFTVLITLFLIPFFVQPTLVRGYFSPLPWIERAANLADGTAIVESVDSVIGLYRKFYSEPIIAEGVSSAELEKIFDKSKGDVFVPPKPSGNSPMMDRWDPYIERTAKGDAAKFAYLKAFMWVESGGRQYALSKTGCSGLMQFCTGTAKSEPFRSIFGRGTVYRCKCKNRVCSVPRSVQKGMETGNREELESHASSFPCELTDARFNPSKAIEAGGAYIDKLRKMVDRNIYLMYIGYNSGPKIAKRVYQLGGNNPEMSLNDIETHLTTALRGTYGSSASGRARSLVRTHLPKIKGAYDTYYKP